MRSLRFAFFLAPVLLALAGFACDGLPRRAALPDADPSPAWWVYVGTYTNGTDSEGIYVLRMDAESGALERLSVAGDTVNPSFVALRPDGRTLYAVNETEDYEGAASGAISAFAVHPKTGALRFLNRKASGGGAPCHVVVDRSGHTVLLANYSGGSVKAFAIETDGRLGATTAFVQHEGSSVHARQKGPHAHAIEIDPSGHWAAAADLGLDQVLVYRFDAGTGALAPNDPAFAPVAPGSGPRHFAFHPSGRFAWAINEISRTITSFRFDAEAGTLESVQTISTVPDGWTEGSTAEILVHPSGKFVYGSNRGHDSIAVYSVDEATGELTLVEIEPTGGKTPRSFGIDPAGRFLLALNQSSGSIVVFRIDDATGALERTDVAVDVPAPVSVAIRPAG